LLDFGGFGDTPAPAPAPAGAASIDIFAAQLLAAPPVVEAVSEDDSEGVEEVSVPAPAPPPAPAMAEDPFASMGDLSDKPLSMMAPAPTNKFEFSGNQMGPLELTTPQFGQQWGTCPATSNASIASSFKVDSLDKFMSLCADMGAHKIEAISATNEGICSGIVGGSKTALIHGKVTPLGGGASKVDVTIKSNDATLAGVLAMFMQNILK
jgi:hypothetical protein